MKLFVTGRQHVFDTLEEKIAANDHIIWFHVASLGEYEQAVPIINALKKNHPIHKILVSFFSPSGYEVKKNNSIADVVVYLPLDSIKNAKQFIKLAHPDIAVFIKYEIWPNYLRLLKKEAIPTILASGLFRSSQIYFKPYGGFMKKALCSFDYYFVQDNASKTLLQSIGIDQVSVSGDTRFDRVSHQIEMNNTLAFIEEFLDEHLCVVCGSTWPEDDAILINYVNSFKEKKAKPVKFIIAPHEIKPEKIKKLREKLKLPTVSYSNKDASNLKDHQVFIIDTIGLLTKIYSYANIAYVGGAMGTSGLHNILEPATFGVPIVIGCNYEKFPEANRLRQLAGLYSVKNEDDVASIFNKLIYDDSFRETTGLIAEHFINSNTGATKITVDYINNTLRPSI
ncbi:3-deoxy-D-manno-octulosonic acid transferase [Croceibacter atlanticus]|jgi:3-deoxy-D-manno-octulosonic-acid transferase|uniref:3-deoxy-D-manno-octulosonic acid transferase n=1 Tax=Croceibacter atlanticus (strain ATCC BAA-628 / JCM 21780 / CIP 108009 / IAM 15332 / KCTC 12090 / HTCC2559) TaxID=216432 RepID=A3UB48_CROAH|nr:glycosyltransferase N-terminal domain-containing protein [Croceibacter atlanticus]EAP87034.1 3-deoxy-D-manno-octulosonic-acid transferase [Croceibacter atlanticus HTCC2559]